MKYALLLILLLPLLATGPAHSQASASGSMNQPADPYRILGNLYYVGASDVTSFLVATSAGLILIDSGFAETVPMIRKNVETLGFKMEDVKILLNSHAHFDHAGGLAAIKKQTGARLAASQADAALLANGGRGDHLFGDKYPYEPVTADRFLKDGDRVELGGTTLTAHLTPGHTKGCTTWTMKAKEGGKSYDVVFVCSTTVLPDVSLTNNAKYPNVAADFEQTFRTLRGLPCDVFLASHASFYNGLEKAARLRKGAAPNPFIDPARYKAYLDRSEKAFRERLAAEKAKDKAAAKTAPVRLLLDSSVVDPADDVSIGADDPVAGTVALDGDDAEEGRASARGSDRRSERGEGEKDEGGGESK